MLVNNCQFIQLTVDSVYETLEGQPVYIDRKKISAIYPRFDIHGNKKGSLVYLEGYMEDDGALMVKESPEDIIGLINDGSFCAFSNKTIYDRIPYPKK